MIAKISPSLSFVYITNKHFLLHLSRTARQSELRSKIFLTDVELVNTCVLLYKQCSGAISAHKKSNNFFSLKNERITKIAPSRFAALGLAKN